VKEERSTVHAIKERKANWIGHILHRKCLLNHVIKGKIGGRREVTERRGRRRKQLLDDFKEPRGCWKLKEEALDHTRWRTCFRTAYGTVVRQITECICLRTFSFRGRVPKFGRPQSFRSSSVRILKTLMYSPSIENEETLHLHIFSACQTTRKSPWHLKACISPLSDVSMRAWIPVAITLRICCELWLYKQKELDSY
jgi:hypothetical protein